MSGNKMYGGHALMIAFGITVLAILLLEGGASAETSLVVKKLTQLTTDPTKEWQPAWSPDGKEIVFERFTNPSKMIKLKLADLSELQVASHGWINGNPCIFGEPSFSPDGSKITYGKDDCNGWVDIFAVNSDGTSDKCLTCSYSGENVEPTWSPFSKKILYRNAANCCNMYPWSIFSINPDGTGKTSLGIAEYMMSYGALSSDESKIIYIEAGFRDSLPWKLKIKDLKTNTIKILETCNAYKCFLPRQSQSWQSQVFSPDNKKIVYTSYEKGNSDIYTINIDGTGKTQLTTDTSDDGAGYSASFSPDGNKIVYVSNKAGNNDIWMMDANGDNKAQLTTDHGDDISPSWSPDGSKILFVSDRSGNYNIWMMELSQSNVYSKGNGVWLYGFSKSDVEAYTENITKYNLDSNNKITYLFPRAGHLNLKENLEVDYSLDAAKNFRAKFPQIYIYPMIDSNISLAGNTWDKNVRTRLSEEEIKILAGKIAEKINSDPNADGLHLDIEPYDDNLTFLVKEIRKRTYKPISVATENPLPPSELFENTNFVVLMNYDLPCATTPYPLECFWTFSAGRAIAFLNKAKISNGYGMIGVPAIATSHEWEYKKDKEDVFSGTKMTEYLDAAINAKNYALNCFFCIGKDNYLGISIWALMPDSPNSQAFLPYNISEKSWAILKEQPLPEIKSSTGKGAIYFETSSGNLENLIAVHPNSIPQPPPSGLDFYYGLFRFDITGIGTGGSTTLTMKFPNNIPKGTTCWKFGATSSNVNTHWYTFPCKIEDNKIILTLTDGGAGDDDLKADGTIRDDSGPSTPPKTGDINGNGQLTLVDAIYLAKHVGGFSGYETIYADGDINANGKITLVDAIYLAKHVGGFIEYEKIY